MPRTRQPRKHASCPTDSPGAQSMLKDFEHQSNARLRKLETDFQNMIDNFANQVDLSLSRIPSEIRKLTLRDLIKLDMPNDDDLTLESDKEDSRKMIPPPPTTVKKSKKLKRQTTVSVSDDGYVTEGASSSSSSSKRVSRIDTENSLLSSASASKEKARTRSSTRSQTREQPKVIIQEKKTGKKRSSSACSNISNKQMYMTPAASKSKTVYDCVTPKIKPNSALNMLRRPKDGETVLSMQGSPLLVSATLSEKTANLNVPVGNGNIISFLPNDGLRLSCMPQLDQETMEQLKTLKGHLDRVIGNN